MLPFFIIIQTVDWTVPKPGGGVNEYMEILVKETTTLHKVLSRYLALSVVEVREGFFVLPLPIGNLVIYSTDRPSLHFQYVMTQVFAAINHRLSEEYGAIYLPDQEAKTRCVSHSSRIDSFYLTILIKVACGCKVLAAKIFCA
jgi:vacuolar protein sorting-associated protein 54